MKSARRWIWLAIALFFFADPVLAARTAGEIGQNIGEQASGLAFAATRIGILIGLVLVIVSIVIFASIKKTQTPVIIPVLMLVCGIALLSIGAVIAIGSTSVFGNDEASEALHELGVH